MIPFPVLILKEISVVRHANKTESIFPLIPSNWEIFRNPVNQLPNAHLVGAGYISMKMVYDVFITGYFWCVVAPRNGPITKRADNHLLFTVH